MEVVVPGSVDEVWGAIATGPGLSSWFVPSELDLGPDGTPATLVCHFGAGMDSAATIIRWDPPNGFGALSEDFVPGGPVVATDWTVEPSGAETCVVRVEHSLSADSDEWDVYLEATESGWPAFFRILQIYLTGFPGQTCALVEPMGTAEEAASGWTTLAEGLGLVGAVPGERRSAPDATLELDGTVDTIVSSRELLLRLNRPAPGVAHLFAMPMGSEALLSVRLYLYGDAAPATAARVDTAWRTWMAERFS